MEPGPQSLLLEAAREVLRELGWDGVEEPGGPALEDSGIAVTYGGENGNWVLIIDTYPDEAVLLVYSLYHDHVPAELLAATAEFVTRLNDGLPRATIELDLDTGAVSCRTSLDVEGVALEALAVQGHLLALVRRVVLANIATFDLMLAGLTPLLEGRATPSEAEIAAFGD